VLTISTDHAFFELRGSDAMFRSKTHGETVAPQRRLEHSFF
jgi:hypothetical protein